MEFIGLPTLEQDVPLAFSDLEKGTEDPQWREKLKKASIGVFEVGEKNEAFLMRKASTYSGEPGLDNMLVVYNPDKLVGSIGDLSPEEGHQIMEAIASLEASYKESEEKHPQDSKHKIASTVVGINFHPHPVKFIKERKMFAQTLKHLHIHVTGMTESDQQRMEKIDAEEMLKTAQDPKTRQMVKEMIADKKDPLLEIFQAYFANQLALENDVIKPKKEKEAGDVPFGVNFEVKDKEEMAKPEFFKELQNIHRRYQELYSRISSIFIDESKQDSYGMPVVRSYQERLTRLASAAGMEDLNIDEVNDNDIDKMTQNVLGLKKERLTDSERLAVRKFRLLIKKLKDLPAEETGEDLPQKILLRGAAYTLTMKTSPDGRMIVNFAPRLISIGNMLDSMGFVRKRSGKFSEEQGKERQERESAVFQGLKKRLSGLEQGGLVKEA